MAEPKAGPVAATKEGSDSNSPAQHPAPHPPASSSSITTTSPSSKLLFHCGLDSILHLSYLEMQANVGHVQWQKSFLLEHKHWSPHSPCVGIAIVKCIILVYILHLSWFTTADILICCSRIEIRTQDTKLSASLTVDRFLKLTKFATGAKVYFSSWTIPLGDSVKVQKWFSRCAVLYFFFYLLSPLQIVSFFKMLQ